MAGTLQDTVCQGLRLAREHVSIGPRPAFESLQAKVRVGSFLRPLPPTSHAALRMAGAMMDMALQSDPSWLDGPPVVETVFGRVPVLLIERCSWLERLDQEAGAGDGTAEGLMGAAVVLDQHLVWLERTWEAVRRRLWQTLYDAEAVAADLLSAHLTANLVVAGRERARYLYPGTELLPRAESPDFRDLRRALGVVAQARRSADIEAIKTEEWVVEAVSLALTTIAVAGAMSRRAVLLDERAWREINAAAKIADLARAHTAEAIAAYLQVLRREALQHPLVLVLDHHGLAGGNPLQIARDIDLAVRDAEQAIARIRSAGVNGATVPEQRRAQDLTPSGLAGRLASAGAMSVWKLPFFIERALCELPPERGSEVVRLMELAAETAQDDALKRCLAMFGIDTALMFAPAAGPVGIGLALAWALFSLGNSISEYQQLSALYHATLDPAVLLRGTDHEEASKLSIVLDVIGLIVW
jgi:hypothetical protein